MIKLFKKESLNVLLKYPKEIVDSVNNIINILDESYGKDRKLTDDGGYVCVIEDIEDVEYLKSNVLKGIVEEFSDVVHKDETKIYSSTLYLLSSDYSVIVISKNEETEYLLK